MDTERKGLTKQAEQLIVNLPFFVVHNLNHCVALQFVLELKDIEQAQYLNIRFKHESNREN